ncbi:MULTISPECIES: ankyrin repeat domain-containing protein [Chryseobacterium]|uniref:ankyrin repeat domain-containing protein n=1 Tax=Chryseobacterium TaxID=59732 RepID=UPI001624F5C1|nr:MULTISPECIES: ankyrin repeat domain-containing protein [Chryseobacterium]MDM1556374.1 ankyrin repeat domain-containing protein [Chryseobacterium indologenes]
MIKNIAAVLTIISLVGCKFKEEKKDNQPKTEKAIIKDTIAKPQQVVETSSQEQEDHLKYNQLGLAVKAGNIEEVGKLLKNGADINNAAEDEYYAYGALYIAINTKNEAMVKFLIENKADLNTQINEEGYSLLVAAINSGNANIVNLLIQSGTRVETFTDPEGNKKFIPILEAAQSNQPEVVKLLLEKGADPNETSFEGFSAYKYAQENNKSIFNLFKK